MSSWMEWESTHLIMQSSEPTMSATYRASLNGLNTVANGGGVRGGNRALSKNHDGNVNAAFMHAMMSIVSRNPTSSNSRTIMIG